MNAWFKGLTALGFGWVAKTFRAFVVEPAMLHAAIWYVRAIRTARSFYRLGVATTLSLALAGIGFVLFHVGLFALLPAPANALALMGLGTIYVVAALCVLRALSAEARWLKASGAQTCVPPAEPAAKP